MFKNSFYKHIRKYSGFRKSAYVSFALLSLITIAILCPIYLVPDSIEATSKPAQPASLNYSATSSTASVAFDVSSSTGTFASSNTSGTSAEFSISTDNATGYVLTLRTSGSDTTLKDTTNSSNTISNITSTGGITSSNFSVNTWGILPSKYNSTANTSNDPNYYKIDSTGFTMDETSSANSVANAYTVGLGLKVDFTKSAGTYTNTTVIAEYVANAVTYSINYYTNTNDTVTGMPATNPQTGTVSQGTTSTSVNLASAPSRTGYNFLGWCMGTSSSSNITTTSGVDTCGNSSTNQFTAGQSFGIDATRSPDTYHMYAMWQIQSYTQTVRYRYENVDGSFGNYTTVTESKNYGTTYSWSTANITNFDSTTYQSNSITSYTVTGEQSTDINIYRNTFTCTKRYRLQNADGTFPSTYDTSEGTITGVKYGASCSYTKTITDYRGSSTAANGAQGTASSSNVTSDRNIDIDFYRNTYTLTVTAGTNTSSATGGGTYRWGQTVAVGVTKATDITCTSYATPTWSQSGTAGTFSSTSGTSVNFTMGKGTVTVTATSTASSVSQTITLSKGTGVNGITIGGTKYTGTSVSLTCGSYAITAPTANFNSGYEFDSWAVSGTGLTLGSSTTTASNTITVSGSGTLTLNGKLSCQTTVSGTMQAFNPCSSIAVGTSGTLTDSRDNQSYTVIKTDDTWWMTRNLAIGCNGSGSTYGSDFSSKRLTRTSSKVNSSWYTPTLSLDKNDGTTGCTSGSDCNSFTDARMKCDSTYGAWYNYAAATAGTITGDSNETEDTYNICPSGWTLPDIDQISAIRPVSFSGVSGSWYMNGRRNTDYNSEGSWWSTTASNSTNRYRLIKGSSGQLSTYSHPRTYGSYVRCVKIN